MSDIKIFKIQGNIVNEIKGTSVALEKSLQYLMEKNLEEILGIRFLATEYTTGKTHSGRIDSLGIDENGCPVIIEYKRTMNENVINQGLFYLDWLMDHQAEFKLLVLEKLGEKEEIDWSAPRLLCIAGDFTKYDEHAVQQINRNIDLIRYRKFGEDLLLLDLVNASSAQISTKNGNKEVKTVSDHLTQADKYQKNRFETLKDLLIGLGDDVQMKTLKHYFAFKRIKNFACVEIHTQTKQILVYVKVDPDSITLEKGFTRDMKNIWHFGSGDLEITISSDADLEKANDLLIKSYEVS
ncbi:MAG: putative transport protein/Endonuclease NucS [Candidatus Methanocomedens sp.]|nr:MAG: putative transport protein/Endonuclease NucS [ANME-2 cluster archaeon]